MNASSFGTISTSTTGVVRSALGYALGFDTSNTSGYYGGGGTGDSQAYQGNSVNLVLSVTPGDTYTIVVGAGVDSSASGNQGFVKIAYK